MFDYPDENPQVHYFYRTYATWEGKSFFAQHININKKKSYIKSIII